MEMKSKRNRTHEVTYKDLEDGIEVHDDGSQYHVKEGNIVIKFDKKLFEEFEAVKDFKNMVRKKPDVQLTNGVMLLYVPYYGKYTTSGLLRGTNDEAKKFAKLRGVLEIAAIDHSIEGYNVGDCVILDISVGTIPPSVEVGGREYIYGTPSMVLAKVSKTVDIVDECFLGKNNQ